MKQGNMQMLVESLETGSHTTWFLWVMNSPIWDTIFNQLVLRWDSDSTVLGHLGDALLESLGDCRNTPIVFAWLVGGLEHDCSILFFSHILGVIIPIDVHIFQG